MNGAGVESMQAKWDEMFGEKPEELVEEVKVKKPRRKAVVKNKGTSKKSASAKLESGKAKASVKKTLKETKKPAPKKITTPRASKAKTKVSAKKKVDKKTRARKSDVSQRKR